MQRAVILSTSYALTHGHRYCGNVDTLCTVILSGKVATQLMDFTTDVCCKYVGGGDKWH